MELEVRRQGLSTSSNFFPVRWSTKIRFN